jgi:hypothetical protein
MCHLCICGIGTWGQTHRADTLAVEQLKQHSGSRSTSWACQFEERHLSRDASTSTTIVSCWEKLGASSPEKLRGQCAGLNISTRCLSTARHRKRCRPSTRLLEPNTAWWRPSRLRPARNTTTISKLKDSDLKRGVKFHLRVIVGCRTAHIAPQRPAQLGDRILKIEAC